MARALGAGSAVLIFALFFSGCVINDKFPPEGMDHLSMKVDLEVEIFGLGKDSISLEGSSVVLRGDPTGEAGTLMEGDLISARLRGDSKIFGRVVAIASPIRHSPCEYRWKGPNSYDGQFDILSWFFLPRHDLIVFNKKPVRVTGPAKAIPPVGQVAEAEDVPVELYKLQEPGGKPIGSLIRAKGTILSEIDYQENLQIQDETVEELRQ
jgi:hypothetical protein